mgnify:FL=1
MKKLFSSEKLFDILLFIAGSVLYSLSVNVFTLPNHIAPGGLTGVGTLINYLSGFPVGVSVILMNIPLFFFGVRVLGREFFIKTVAATLLSSIFIDIGGTFLPGYSGDHILAAIYGGVLSGAGMSLIFIRGGTTGGTDILAKLIKHTFPHLSIGHIILALDAIILMGAALVYKSIDSALYAIIVIYVSTTIIDRSIYGVGSGKVIYIFSKKSEQIAARVTEQLKRGATLLKTTGAYSGDDRKVVMCALRRHEVFSLKKIVLDIDPTAFVIVGDVGQVMGKGFNSLKNSE